jgi:hypothetical protein
MNSTTTQQSASLDLDGDSIIITREELAMLLGGDDDLREVSG